MTTKKKSSDNAVAAAVILYNPAANVSNNINSYLQQVDYLFILDNSPATLSDNPFINNNKIAYIFNNGNIGIAAALNKAADKAYRTGYEYLLTMDQDSIVPPGMVESLLKVICGDNKIGIISPLHSNKFGTHLKNEKGIREVSSVMTSGNIISLDIFNKIGPFSEDYFIDYVDVEYCFRLKKKGYKILCNFNIIMEHNEANLSRKTIFNREFFPPNHNPRRMYYKSRNLMFLRKTYKKVLPEHISIETKLFLRSIIKVLLFEKQKFFKVKMVLLGLLDYFKGLKGKKF
jgi:rhamnosyltransferase